jgi:acyl carrier protein
VAFRLQLVGLLQHSGPSAMLFARFAFSHNGVPGIDTLVCFRLKELENPNVISGEINSKLTTIFRDVFDDPDLTPNREMTADDVSEWDSLSHVRLILTIEKVFRVKFTASQIGNLKNVGDLMDFLQSKLG